ncbi:MAG: HDOD domain-containing protein [Steroidobacteraceae bacterium]
MSATETQRVLPIEGVIRNELADLVRDSELSIPSLPDSDTGLMGLTGVSDAAVSKLVAAAERTPLLRERVLRVATLAAQLDGSGFSSIHEAIAHLGTAEVADIVLTAVVHGRLFDDKRCAGVAVDAWRRSIATAIWAREIGAVSRRGDEYTYLGGLLHDLGQHVAKLACAWSAVRLGLDPEDADTERAALEHGSHFTRTLCDQWPLPDAVIEVIRNWEAWTPHDGAPGNAAVVQLAHYLAEIAYEQGPELTREALAGKPLLDTLRISPDRFNALLSRAGWVKAQAAAY